MINKKVIHTNMYAHPIIVYDCPLNVRTFKSGSKQGQSYACVFDDCFNCCFGNVRKEVKNFNNEDIECGRIYPLIAMLTLL
jgi:hypothetical protein